MAMRRATTGTILALAIIALVVGAMGALVTTRTVGNTGNIAVVTPSPTVQLGVYSDSGCTSALSSISWGTLSPGNTTTSTMFVRNEGNVAVTLSIQAADWSPANASSYLLFDWNCTGYVLQPSEVVQALLTLNVSSSISGITSFSFDITIMGTQ